MLTLLMKPLVGKQLPLGCFSLVVLTALFLAPVPIHAAQANREQSMRNVASLAVPVATISSDRQAVWASWAYYASQVLGNRTRMIQVTLLFVVLGVMLLMWGKK